MMSEHPVAKKSLGQHWLFDVSVLNDIAEAAEITEHDHILEIGPGPGALTEILLTSGAEVAAVEIDKQLFTELKKTASDWYSKDVTRLHLVNQDILTFDLTTLPVDYKVVANIPYYLTSHLLRVLSESSNPPSLCVLLVQKEVAQRVAAGPGDMSLLSVVAQFYWQVSLSRVVEAKLFTPAPKVNSQVLVLKRRAELPIADVEPKHFFRLVKAGFAARRKTLVNSLSVGLKIGKAETTELLQACNIDPRGRPQELSIEKWGELYKQASKFL